MPAVAAAVCEGWLAALLQRVLHSPPPPPRGAVVHAANLVACCSATVVPCPSRACWWAVVDVQGGGPRPSRAGACMGVINAPKAGWCLPAAAACNTTRALVYTPKSRSASLWGRPGGAAPAGFGTPCLLAWLLVHTIPGFTGTGDHGSVAASAVPAAGAGLLHLVVLAHALADGHGAALPVAGGMLEPGGVRLRACEEGGGGDGVLSGRGFRVPARR